MELKHHVPHQIQLYNQGFLKATQARIQKTTGLVQFTLDGDIDAKLLVGFEDEELFHQDMVLEIANIVASKFVSSLYDADGLLIELSPPAYLDAEEKAYKSLFVVAKNYASYEFQFASTRRKPTTIQIVYIPITGGTA